MRNQAKRYRDLGYDPCTYDEVVQVRIEDLPPNSNKIISCQCDECGKAFKRNLQLLNRPNPKIGPGHFCYPCVRKIIGKKMDMTRTIAASKTRTGEKHPRYNPNHSEYRKYSSKVWNYTRQSYRRDKDTINPYDLPRRLCGVVGGYQLDHRVSVKQGFRFGINPRVIGSTDNLRMISWAENLGRRDNSRHPS